MLLGLIVGWLMLRLLGQSTVAETRAAEAEQLRDQLGRRADVLEAANRCARALSSSLELDQAFDAFIREVRGLLPFDRIAIVLSENGVAQVMAVAGEGAEDVLPPGSGRPIHGTLLEELLRTNQTVYRRDMSSADYPEEDEFLALGLHCRLATPLLQGARAIGMLSLVRREPDAFSPEDIELAGLLGRLVASAVQNIRAYETERKTVEELRRLSALRADFVSLVSHELRTPMAAVIGAARTLQQRWRELSPDQRESFLELIAGETNRLAELIGDVLDTSRIEAGTFSFRFQEVDLGQLVHDAVSTAQVGQDEVRLRADVPSPLPRDPRRPRPAAAGADEPDRQRDQVLAGRRRGRGARLPGERPRARRRSRPRARDREGRPEADLREVRPRDRLGRARGPGPASASSSRARSRRPTAAALEVQSSPERGATFTLELPLARLGDADARRPSSRCTALARGRRSRGAELGRLEHDRLAAVAEDLADQPLRAADRPLGDRRAVREPARALLQLPARDLGRVPDARGPGVAELVRVEALARLEVPALDPGAAHPVEPERALAVARAVPACARTSTAACARASTARRGASRPLPRPPSGSRPRRGGARAGRG